MTNNSSNSLIVIEDGTYVGKPINRKLVVEFGDTLMGVHPNAQEVGKMAMRAVAQLALMTGANPLPGTNGIHVWKDNKGRVCVQLGIGFLRGEAEKVGGILWVTRPRAMTDEERAHYEVKEKEHGAIAIGALKRDVFDFMRDCRAMGVEVTISEAKNEVSRVGVATVGTDTWGSGDYKEAKSGRPLIWTALERAERDLLRKLVPILQRKRPELGGEGWSAGQYARIHNKELAVADGYTFEDANDDLYDSASDHDNSGHHFEGADDTPPPDNKYITEDIDDTPLPNDEQAIADAPASEFIAMCAALIDRYDNVHAVKNALKKIGHTGVKKSPAERLQQYRELRDHAASRDAEEAEVHDAPLFDDNDKEAAGAYAE